MPKRGWKNPKPNGHNRMLCTCLRCGYQWLSWSGSVKPKRCARCHTPNWDRLPTRIRKDSPAFFGLTRSDPDPPD